MSNGTIYWRVQRLEQDIKDLGVKVERLQADVVRRDEEHTKSSKTQRIAYVSAAGAVIASMLVAIAQVVGHA